MERVWVDGKKLCKSVCSSGKWWDVSVSVISSHFPFSTLKHPLVSLVKFVLSFMLICIVFWYKRKGRGTVQNKDIGYGIFIFNLNSHWKLYRVLFVEFVWKIPLHFLPCYIELGLFFACWRNELVKLEILFKA